MAPIIPATEAIEKLIRRIAAIRGYQRAVMLTAMLFTNPTVSPREPRYMDDEPEWYCSFPLKGALS